jgi:hypothetical protein
MAPDPAEMTGGELAVPIEIVPPIFASPLIV